MTSKIFLQNFILVYLMNKKLNVLHISPDFNYVCGVSKYIYLLFKELKGNDKINLFFITNRGDSLEKLEKLDYKPVLINFSKGWKNIFHFYSNLHFLENYCRENKIDIIHTHHRYPELLSNLLKKRLPIKTITTVHSLVDGYKNLSFKSDLIIAVSKSVKENIVRKFGVPEEKIIQIYNPLDFEELEKGLNSEFRINHAFSADAKVFLYVGRWTKIKGVDILADVFSKIFKKYQNTFLVIISDIPKKEKTKIEKLDKNFILIEPQNDVRKYFLIADAVVLPSRIEPFPFVMLEAGFYKKLFIGTNTGGIGEFIEDGKNGLLFEPENKMQLKKIIIDVINNRFEFELIADNLNEKIYKTIPSVKTYTEKLVEVYYKLYYQKINSF